MFVKVMRVLLYNTDKGTVRGDNRIGLIVMCGLGLGCISRKTAGIISYFKRNEINSP